MSTLQRPGVVQVSTIADCFEQTAQRCSHEAVVFPHERVTYPELSERSDRIARALIGAGVRPRDKVGMLMHQGVDYLAVLLAASKVAAVAVPVNSRYKPRELSHVIVNSDMAVLVSTHESGEHVDFPALLQEALPSLASSAGPELELDEAPELRRIVMLGDVSSKVFTSESAFYALGDGVADDAILDRREMVAVRDTAVIMYTSGTTAMPKGAMLSHESLVREGIVVGRTRFFLTESDRMWTALPLYHIGGIAFSIACFAVGATYVHCGFFHPDSATRQLMDERATIALPTFETIWLAMLDHPEFDVERLDQLRIVFNVGVPERLRKSQERVPHATQISGFGSTESSSFLCLGDVDDPLDVRVNTCGRPVAGAEVRIVSPETGEEVPPNTPGEILYRGWSVFGGYYNDPERTAEAIDSEGWFHSGDLCKLDEDGRLSFVGRLKDMLKVGGENVAAAEVEGYLLTHPAVMLAQVVSAPDARYSEVAAAYLQLVPGAEVTEQEIIDFCLGEIATFKVPRYVRIVDEWPMSGTKIKKYVLRERIAEELASAGITEAPKLNASKKSSDQDVVTASGGG